MEATADHLSGYKQLRVPARKVGRERALRSEVLKLASDINAPERTFPERLAPGYWHWRRSSTRSDTALAWPMVLPT